MKTTIQPGQVGLFELPDLGGSSVPASSGDVYMPVRRSGTQTVPAAEVRDDGTWTIVIPSPCEWLTANFRGHWRAKARIEKEWRKSAYVAALAVRPPTGLDLVRVDVLFRYVRKPVREIENLRPTLKNCVDGAIGPQATRKGKVFPGYGVVVDDSDKHLIYGSYAGEKIPATAAVLALKPWAGEVVLTVTELCRANSSGQVTE